MTTTRPHIDLKALIRDVPDYHPDADINFDGVIDLFNDIVGVGQQVGDVCAVDHYPQS